MEIELFKDNKNKIDVLGYKSMHELKNKFVKLFNNIFKYNDKIIKVVGDINNPYFRAKDVLNILEYNEGSFKQILYRLDKDYKTDLKTIIENNNEVVNKMCTTSNKKHNNDNTELVHKMCTNSNKKHNNDNTEVVHKMCTTSNKKHNNYDNEVVDKMTTTSNKILYSYNEGKEIYLNEAGLYYLIIKSNMDKAINFQKYICLDLLPSMRKSICKELMDNIERRDDKIDELIKQNNVLIKEIQLSRKDLKDIKEDLEDVNDELNNTNFNLNSLTEVINNELLPNRNLSPETLNLQHYLMLYLKDKKYYFIRGQLKHIKKIIKDKNLKTENIIIDLTKFPNPIDFINKIKEKSKFENREIKNNIKEYIRNKYDNISEEKFNSKYNRMYNKNKIFEIKNNELILNTSKIEDIINIYNNLLEERNNIINIDEDSE